MKFGKFTGVNALMLMWVALTFFNGWQVGKYGAFWNIVAAIWSLVLAVAFGCFANIETARMEGDNREMDRRWRQ